MSYSTLDVEFTAELKFHTSTFPCSPVVRVSDFFFYCINIQYLPHCHPQASNFFTHQKLVFLLSSCFSNMLYSKLYVHFGVI